MTLWQKTHVGSDKNKSNETSVTLESCEENISNDTPHNIAQDCSNFNSPTDQLEITTHEIRNETTDTPAAPLTDRTIETQAAKNSTPIDQIWSEEQKNSFLKSNDWLFVANGKLGCSTCKRVANTGVGVEHGQGVHVSKEWANCEIGTKKCEGELSAAKKVALFKILRNKIYRHRDSRAHVIARGVIKSQNVDPLGKASSKAQSRSKELTKECLRTAYYVAHKNKPFSDYESLVELQELNGVDLGATLHSRDTCSRMISTITK